MRTFNTENATVQQRRPAMRITPIAAACSALLLASGGAFAQQAAGEPIATVVVSGIRGSIDGRGRREAGEVRQAESVAHRRMVVAMFSEPIDRRMPVTQFAGMLGR